ncbi:MAG TPA: thiamine-phosphate kinase [Propionibacteriaceae bacterium]|nr:thiamine-phosphate kinase [Propionibacteriaceae bacterium]
MSRHDGQPTLGELGEFALIASVTADLPATAEVQVGPGDDAAVLDLAGPMVTSMDVLVEGVHFRRDWSSADDVGRKAVAVNVADLEAMGARAVGLLVGFSAPADLPASWAYDFAAGLRAECASAGVALLGGDTTRARDITVSVTVLGTLDGRSPVCRDGARAGDVVALVGRTGWAAAGLVVLGRGFRSPRVVVEAQRVPEVAYGAGAVAARAGASSMIDISDGLLADLGHVARASAVVIELQSEAFPAPEPLRIVSVATGTDPMALMLTGGEDHALAASFASVDAVPDGWRVVGRVRDRGHEEPAGVLVDGSPWSGPGGYAHFRRR